MTQVGKLLGISVSPRALQSTLVPRQLQTDGQANRADVVVVVVVVVSSLFDDDDDDDDVGVLSILLLFA